MKRINFYIWFITFSILILSFTGCVDITPQTEHVQNKRTNKWYESVEEAINQAQPKDILLVQPGIYTETLFISKEITIKAIATNYTQTTIKGNNIDDVIYIIANNVTIDGFTISGGGNNTESNVYGGIHLRSDYNQISNCLVTDNNNYGIYIYGGSFNAIRNCTIHSNGNRGIYAYSCSNSYIENNTIHSENHGIYSIMLTDSFIMFNTLSDLRYRSVYLGRDTSGNLLKDNIIQNSEDGVYVQGATDNTFIENLFINNLKGIYFCCGGSDNLIYKNIFLNNQQHAYSNPVNLFFKNTTGNYWDDYNGTDENNDGRGDTPYIISCHPAVESCNQDQFPMMKPE